MVSVYARTRSWVRAWVLGTALLMVATVLVGLPQGAVAAPCDAPVVNEVACENTRTGTPRSQWDITGSGSSSIQGFATDISVNRGSAIGFKVRTSASSHRLDIYRMGYYGGAGARLVHTIDVRTGTRQPGCLSEQSTGLVDCGNWTQTASWSVPSTAVSGVYFAKLVAGTAASHVFFVVRDDASRSDLLFQTADTTWQAYNDFGGNSLYEGNPAGRAYKVSYNRPFDTAAETPEDWVFSAEYPMIRFLEANGYDVSYTTGVDSDRRGELIKNHKAFVSVGHDEYWSGAQRAAVESARDAGVHLAFFSGNEVFWKTRWESSIAAGGAAHRTLVTYKETLAGAKIDPTSTWTGTWRDPRFSPPSDGGRPENGLTGTIFTVNCCTTDMRVDGTDGQMRFWRNTRVASLAANQGTTLGSGILGYEWDEPLDNGHRPAGLIYLSTTSADVPSYLQDHGSSYAPGSATHHLTLYRAASGALVFGAGSVQWSWGLDDDHWGSHGATSDAAVRQATVNLFADMGVQPATLQTGLVAASASTDTTPPTSTITAPAAGAAVRAGEPVVVSGTASDTGGRVGGVEVSVDGGASWHPAHGRTAWSYTFTPVAEGTVTVRSRAADDSGRIETPSAGLTLTVGGGQVDPAACPCTIWPATATPAVLSDPDTAAVEVGVKFRASQSGAITGIRFYKGSGNTGTHVGSLWSATGSRLATATFGSESATGWQQVLFAAPVPVTAGTTYVASYHAPVGRYSVTENYFGSAVARGPLTALADGTDGVNGVYRYGASGFPTQGYAASNYWVDVVFTTGTAEPDTTPPTVTGHSPADGATDVARTSGVTATFSEDVQADTVVLGLSGPSGPVAGTTAYAATTRTATFTPSAELAEGSQYTATVSGAKDLAGNTMAAPTSWGFTTTAPALDLTPPTVISRTPADGAVDIPTSASVSATFSEPVQESTVTMTLTGPDGAVAGSTTYDGTTRTVTLEPAAALSPSTSYTARVADARDVAGNPMTSPVTWTFTTAAPSGCPCSIWPATAVPKVAADPDTAAVELGVKFQTSRPGSIIGIRFYKATTNTGTHVASLWSRTGTKLAGATFTAETASGWQQVLFASPVPISANTTYVASYHAPVGRYSVDEGYFASAPTTNGPVTALQGGTDGANGVYRYGAGGFPTSTYNASNYWVDVVFATD